MRTWMLMIGLVGLAGASGAEAQDDVGAAVEAVCCGANCCLIGSDCVGRGARNPANNCEQCDPSMSQSIWSPVSGCTPAGTDAGRRDGGTTTPPARGGCSVAPVAGGSAALLTLAPFAFLLVRRRR